MQPTDHRTDTKSTNSKRISTIGDWSKMEVHAIMMDRFISNSNWLRLKSTLGGQAETPCRTSTNFWGAASELRHFVRLDQMNKSPLWFKVVFNRLISKYKSELFVTKTSRELLFDGYEDPLLDLAKHFPSGKFPPFDKFAWFYQVNFVVHRQKLINQFMDNCGATIPIIVMGFSP